jgi:hypothetical protein
MRYKYSQLDITEHEDVKAGLDSSEWVPTIPIISRLDPIEGVHMGLVSIEATPEEAYKRAESMSNIRAQLGDDGDGVYCPICHKVNIELTKLGTPCHTCVRPLLRFGLD